MGMGKVEKVERKKWKVESRCGYKRIASFLLTFYFLLFTFHFQAVRPACTPQDRRHAPPVLLMDS